MRQRRRRWWLPNAGTLSLAALRLRSVRMMMLAATATAIVMVVAARIMMMLFRRQIPPRERSAKLTNSQSPIGVPNGGVRCAGVRLTFGVQTNITGHRFVLRKLGRRGFLLQRVSAAAFAVPLVATRAKMSPPIEAPARLAQRPRWFTAWTAAPSRSGTGIGTGLPLHKRRGRLLRQSH